MVKKILILALFLFLPFLSLKTSVVFAQTPTPEPEEVEETKSGWEKFWEDIGNWFAGLFRDIGSWFSKDVPISCEPKSSFTDYDAETQDVNTRAQSSSTQKYRKGTYLKAIIDGAYDDSNIAYLCNNTCSNTKTSDTDCTDIKYSTLVYFFYQKGEKILFDKSDSKNPIEYDSEKMDSYGYTIPQGTDSYFRNLYNNISQIPKGAYQGEEDAAAASSSELNGSLRTFIPASNQSEKPSSDISSEENTQAMSKDNEYQQRAVFSNFIPAKSQNQVLGTSSDNQDGQILGISTDTDGLKKMYSDYLHPQSWQKDQDDGLVDREDDSGGTCNAQKSHCRGMSQYGALGMSISGKTYEEILRSYYGSDIKLVNINTITSNTYIKVSPQSDDSCGSSKLEIEDYLKGLGELPNYWGSEKTGGMAAMEAQAIAARTYAYVRTNGLQNYICTSSRCQVFRCSNIGSRPNFNTAVNNTSGLIVVDANTGKPFSTEYARSFCGPSKSNPYSFNGSTHTTPSYDGKTFEQTAFSKLGKPSNAYCK